MPYIGAGVQRFNTADELTVTGNAEFNGNVDLQDNDKLLIGTSDDLEIFHDGSNSVISDQGTGNLNILASDKIKLGNAAESEIYARFNKDGNVELRHDNSIKLETTATGIDITGGFAATDGCTITTADNDAQLILKSTDADANSGPVLDLIRDSSSPAADDGLGRIRFKGDDAGGNEHNYAQIQAKIVDATDGSEGSEMQFHISRNGSVTSGFTLHESEAVFNDGSLDADFRVESNGDANLLKVDAGNDVFGVGAASPDTTFRTSIHGDGSSIVGGTLYRNSSAGGNTFTVGFVNATSTSGKLNVVGAANLIFATNNTEAARITSGGRVGIGQNSPAGRLDVNNDGATTETLLILSDFGGTGAHTQISFNNTAGQVGTINTSGSGTTYSTTSDIRLKQDIEPLEATDKLMDMNPVSYAWKADPDGPRSMGFIAQEMKEIVPDAVFGDDSEEKMMSMDYGRITPVLVSALQDAHKKIEELESRIAAMESK